MTKGDKLHYMLFGALFPWLIDDLIAGNHMSAAITAAVIAFNFAIEFIPKRKTA